MSANGNLPPGLIEGFLRLCQGDFSFRLPRSNERDEHDTAAFFFNAVAEEIERILRTSREQEVRLTSSYAQLARTQEHLAQRERLAAIGELAAVVAHEVRNPLAVIFNSLGALRRMLPTDGAAKPTDAEPGELGPLALVEIMQEEAVRLNHIVGDLLDFARPSMPTLLGERIDEVLGQAVDAALVDARDRIRVVSTVGELPLIPMDARLMRQALLNLLLNAVQSMGDGGTLTLTVRRDETERGSMARIEIADTGTGIPPDVEPRIFEPFFTTRATGTGLGLAVVKRIVESHRGTIRVTTGPACGTTFVLLLPLD